MILLDNGIAQHQTGVGVQIHIAIQAHRHQCRIPVPAEITLRLAQHVAADPRIMFGERHKKWLTGLAFIRRAHGRMEGDLDGIAASCQLARQRKPIAAKGVFCHRDGCVIHTYAGNRIKARDNKISICLIRSKCNCPGGGPVAISNPADIIFIHPPIGVGNLSCRMKRRYQITGQRDIKPVGAGLVTKLPLTGKCRQAHSRSSVTLSNKCRFSGFRPISTSWPSSSLT